MPLTEDRLSVFDLVSMVQVSIPQGANPDITVDPVFFAVVPGAPSDNQRPTEWFEGFWQLSLGGVLACCTVGPDTVPGPFAPGMYAVWLKVTDNPTAPVRCIDTLFIT